MMRSFIIEKIIHGIVMAALCGGCASPSESQRAPASIHQQVTAPQRNEHDRLTSATADTQAMPPGVEPSTLTPRERDDPHAFRSLQEALQKLSQVESFAESGTQEPIDPDRRARAVAHYAKARTTALDGRFLQAIIELQKARDLDPDSTEVLRELARCYFAVNNSVQAVETYEHLLRREPTDVDALFAVGMTAASRRDFQKAINSLSRWSLIQPEASVDPATQVVVHFALAASLQELGYDRAFIEAATRAVDLPDELMDDTNSPRLASVYRQRGETWRSMGDAHCRLGQYTEALHAYAQSSALPTADPVAVLPRIMYANLRLNRADAAQQHLVDAITQADESTTERLIELCSYLRMQMGSTPMLSEAVEARYRANPDNGALARAAATLLPREKARDLLRDFVARQPRHLDGVMQLLKWLAEGDATQAADLAVALAAAHPDLAEGYADRLALAVAHMTTTLEALRSLPPSSARARTEARIIWKAGALGEAWSVIRSGRETWPDDRPLALQQLHLAATMQETQLFEQTLRALPPMDDVQGLIALSQGYRALGRIDQALAVAVQAAEQEPTNADAITERARAHLAKAASLATDPATRVDAVAALESALADADSACTLAPGRDEPYEVLAMIYMPGGVRADTDSFRALIQRMRQSHPDSPLLARLAAQEEVVQRRFDRAVERLLQLYERDPIDGAVLGLAVAAWQQARKLDAASVWLDQRMVQHPGETAALEQWVRVQLMQNRAADAIARLKAIKQNDPEHVLADRLLEMAHRAAGNTEEATVLGERRLQARPQGTRREIELAALYAMTNRTDAVIQRLEWVRDHAPQATQDELVAAMSVLSRLEDLPQSGNALALQLATQTIEQHPDAPLSVYGYALLAMSRSGALQEDFDALADRAVVRAKGAGGPGVASAQLWRDLAQALVDEDQPEAAAHAVRARLRSDSPLEDPARGALTVIALVADAAADARQHDARHVQRSMAMLETLENDNRIGVIFREAERASLAEAIYETSAFYTLVGAPTGAQLLLREAIQREPDLAMALNNLAYAMLIARPDVEARAELTRMIERAHALQPDDPSILDSLGWLHYMRGQFDDAAPEAGGQPRPGALTLIQQSITRALSPSPEVIDHKGDVEWRMGRQREAQESWRQVVKLIEDPQYRGWVIDNMRTLQTSGWQLVVVDPSAMYDSEYGPILERAKAKLQAAENGDAPAVAPLFDELK